MFLGTDGDAAPAPAADPDPDKMRQFLLENPDAGEFLRDLATHANARIPDGAWATDPKSVTVDALLRQALTRPVEPE